VGQNDDIVKRIITQFSGQVVPPVSFKEVLVDSYVMKLCGNSSQMVFKE
jgi:hypothetical protein